MKELFPGVRTDGVSEQSLVSTLLKTIGTAILLICVANRQISNRGERIVDDGIVLNSRPYHLVCFALQHPSICSRRSPSKTTRSLMCNAWRVIAYLSFQILLLPPFTS